MYNTYVLELQPGGGGTHHEQQLIRMARNPIRCNSGTSILQVTNHLIDLKAFSIGGYSSQIL